MAAGGGHERRRDSRGQASVIGIVLLLGLTIIGVTAILVVGSTALNASQSDSVTDRAELALTQFDSRVSLSAHGSSERQVATIELSGRGDQLAVDETAGWMNITAVDDDGDVNVTIMNVTMGAVVYENDGVTIAYQGGGVWRKQSEGSVMVSPPEFHYRTDRGEEPTLTLPLVVVRGDPGLSDEVLIENQGTDSKFPDPDDSALSNPVVQEQINITVQSEYYQAWGQFFQQRTHGDVIYDHAEEQVTVVLVPVESDAPTMSAGLLSTAGDELRIQGQTYVDSYNSSEGPYSPNDGGKLVTAGSFHAKGTAFINGSIETGEKATVKGSASVANNIAYTTDEDVNPGSYGGWLNDNGSVPDLDPVDPMVTDTIDDVQGDNNNSDTENITTDNALNFSESDEITLTAGRYYFDEPFQVQNSQQLWLDTSDGDIIIAVDSQDVQIGGNQGRVNVTGPNRVKFYIVDKFTVQDKARVWVPGHNSTQLWVYGGSDATFEFDSSGTDGSVFVGAIYAPTSSGSSDMVQLQNHAQVYGAIVGGDAKLQNTAELHFDEALIHESPVGGTNLGTVDLKYLHVSVTTVNVTDN